MTRKPRATPWVMDTPNERALKGRNTVTFPRQDLEAKCREFGKRHMVAIDEGNVWEGFCNALSGLRYICGMLFPGRCPGLSCSCAFSARPMDSRGEFLARKSKTSIRGHPWPHPPLVRSSKSFLRNEHLHCHCRHVDLVHLFLAVTAQLFRGENALKNS